MVPSTFSRMKAARCLPVILAALIFAGCGIQQPADQSAAQLQGATQADSGFYLQQMQQSSNDSKTNWQLLAIRALLKEGKSVTDVATETGFVNTKYFSSLFKKQFGMQPSKYSGK